MAMRLRKVDDCWVAVCAAKTMAVGGDIYIDDVQDHAIRAKLSYDYRSEGFPVPTVNEKLDYMMLFLEMPTGFRT